MRRIVNGRVLAMVHRRQDSLPLPRGITGNFEIGWFERFDLTGHLMRELCLRLADAGHGVTREFRRHQRQAEWPSASSSHGWANSCGGGSASVWQGSVEGESSSVRASQSTQTFGLRGLHTFILPPQQRQTFIHVQALLCARAAPAATRRAQRPVKMALFMAFLLICGPGFKPKQCSSGVIGKRAGR